MDVFPKYTKNLEVTLINDGSTDKTSKIAAELSRKHKNVKVVDQPNKGYGGALKAGFKNSKYEWVFYSDGDLQFDFEEIKKFLPHTKDQDFIIGFRKNRAEGLKRHLITLLLKVWNKIFFNFPLRIKDTDCAFKLVRKSSLDSLGKFITNGGLISTEILLKAREKELNIKQIPVTHYKRKHGSSTGDSSKVITTAIKETLRLLYVFPSRKRFLLITSSWLTILLLLLPVAFSINYMQNDEYTHYRLIGNFLKGNFHLDPYIGTTFYTQGLLTTVFAFLFGVSGIPVLTLLLSVTGIYFFNLILWKYLNLKPLIAWLVSLLTLLNPWFLYSSWGFMTENYFMFFFIISLYFIYEFSHAENAHSFWLANLFIWLSYGVRQFGLITSAAFTLFLLGKKKFRYAAIQAGNTLLLLLFHYFIFPKTPQMYDERLMFNNLLNVDRVHTIILIIGIYLGVFAAPILLSSLQSKKLFNKKVLLSLAVLPLLFLHFEKKFEPEEIIFQLRNRDGTSSQETISTEFPYLKNIFTRKGFYEDNLPGDKYSFPGYFDLFNILGLMGKLTFIFVLIYALLNLKQVDQFSLWYLLAFTGILLISPRILDRYLLPLVIPATILAVSLFPVNKWGMYALITAAAIWLFLGYQFTSDLIQVNRYIWHQAETIHQTTNTPRNKISADHSWRQLYPNISKNRIYTFTYADYGHAQRSENYELLNKKRVDYPLNFYREPYIYLYKNWGAVEN